eukprot:11675371-Prorocentrum_lima.AAC.1
MVFRTPCRQLHPSTNKSAGACPTASLTIALRVSVAPFGSWSSGKRKYDAPLSHIANGSD